MPNDYKYQDMGTEMWGVMGQALETLSLPDDIILIEQMATRQYKIKPDGRIKLETKDEMKKRSLSSPDRADALALCLCEPHNIAFSDDDTFSVKKR